jgi:hypothetical protein
MQHWSCSDLFKELYRLRNHLGWPADDSFDCPIFTQDKFDYLSRLPAITNPTLKIQLPFPDDINASKHKQLREKIEAFIVADHHEDQGWVVKPPFETNCSRKLLKFCKPENGADGIYAALTIMTWNCYPRLDYVMLQPTMKNRKEYKVRTTVLGYSS